MVPRLSASMASVAGSGAVGSARSCASASSMSASGSGPSMLPSCFSSPLGDTLCVRSPVRHSAMPQPMSPPTSAGYRWPTVKKAAPTG